MFDAEPWSLGQSVNDFFARRSGEPRNFYEHPEVREKLVRDYPDHHSTLVLDTAPDQSNDYLLGATLDDLIRRLPESAKADAGAVFVARTTDEEVNACAYASSATGRVIEIGNDMGPAIFLFAVLQRRVFHFLREHFDRDAESVGEVLALARPRLPELVEEPGFAQIVRQSLRWGTERVDLASEPVQDYVTKAMEETMSDGRRVLNVLPDTGEHFVVAHELAHHLLGHTHDPKIGERSFPLRQELLTRRHQLKVQFNDDVLNEAQNDELCADALAFLIVADELRAASLSFRSSRWAEATMGALLALPVLSVMEVASSDADESTHPPVGMRIRQVVEMTQAFEKSEGRVDPIGLVAQASFFLEAFELAASSSSTGQGPERGVGQRRPIEP